MAEVILNRLFGVDNRDDLRALGGLYVQGNLVLGEPNTESLLTFGKIESGIVTLGTGALTANVGTNLIPAKTFVLGVTLRVHTAITAASGTTFSIGDGSDADRWGASIAFTVNTTTTSDSFTAAGFGFQASATNVVLTAPGNFTAGAVSVVVHTLSIGAPPRLAA